MSTEGRHREPDTTLIDRNWRVCVECQEQRPLIEFRPFADPSEEAVYTHCIDCRVKRRERERARRAHGTFPEIQEAPQPRVRRWALSCVWCGDRRYARGTEEQARITRLANLRCQRCGSPLAMAEDG